MKKKFITKQVLLACKSKPLGIEKDIHTQLANTIAERKRIIQHWEKLIQPKPIVIKSIKKDIHSQLAETIAEHQRIMQQWEWLFSKEHNNHFVMDYKKAA